MPNLNRPFRLFSSLGFALAALSVSVQAGAKEEELKLPDDYGGFVTAEGSKLKLNGGDYYFSGANTYAALYSPDECEEIMKVAKDLGLNAIRFWGFWDGEEPTYDDNQEPTLPPGGTDRWGRPVLQPNPGEYNEIAFRNFDQAIYLAHLYGLKLIIPLLNEWDEFGGLKQNMIWGGIDVPDIVVGCGPDYTEKCFYANEDAIKSVRHKFFTECETCQQTYFNFVEYVLNRVNTVTGVKYKDDPAIMMWEVMNEPRYGPWQGDETATVVGNFLKEGAEFIKSIDKNHLVSTGEEGFFFQGEADDLVNPEALPLIGYGWETAAGEGTSFTLNTSLEAIDVGTYHAWPFNWNKPGDGYFDRIDEFMVEWVESHANAAARIGKPVFLGEFGYQILRQEGSDLALRDKILKATYDAAIRTETAGVMYWNITDRHNPDDAVWTGPIERTARELQGAIYNDTPIPHDQEFRFDIYCPEDESTCAIIREATRVITSRVENPDPPFTNICFTPRTVCGDDCVVLDSSPKHCGECGNECETGESCREGVCTTGPSGGSGAEWGDNSSPYDTSGNCSISSGSEISRGVNSTWFLGFVLGGGALAMFGRRRFS